MNYLASPPLCVAYALAGTMDIDLDARAARRRTSDGEPVYLRDIWPTEQEIARDDRARPCGRTCSASSYADVFDGDERWNGARGARRATASRGSEESTYVRTPPFFEDMPRRAASRSRDIEGARVLALLGDSVTTDHISPAGAIKRDSPAGQLPAASTASQPRDFNSYGARRGNHEVMMRGTFANIRLRNQLAPGHRGRRARCTCPSGEQMTIYDAAMRYARGGRAAGRARGQGVRLGLVARLGGEGHAAARRARGDRRELRAHPPLATSSAWACCRCSSPTARAAQSLGLTGEEVFAIDGIADAVAASRRQGRRATVACAPARRREPVSFDARVRIDTPREVEYFRHGGILQYVLRGLLAA